MSATDLLALYVLIGVALAAHAVLDTHRDEAWKKELFEGIAPLTNHPSANPAVVALVLSVLTIFCLGIFVLAWPLKAVFWYRRRRK